MTLHKSGTGVNAIAGPLTIGAGSNSAAVQLGSNEQINPSVVVSFANNTSSLRLKASSETVGGLDQQLRQWRGGQLRRDRLDFDYRHGGQQHLRRRSWTTASAAAPLPCSWAAPVPRRSPVQSPSAATCKSIAARSTLSGTNTYTGNTIVQGGELDRRQQLLAARWWEPDCRQRGLTSPRRVVRRPGGRHPARVRGARAGHAGARGGRVDRGCRGRAAAEARRGS